MNNNRKLLFFDIDGTLLTPTHGLSGQCKNALEAAHDNGHLLFVNSGRTYAMISLNSQKTRL